MQKGIIMPYLSDLLTDSVTTPSCLIGEPSQFSWFSKPQKRLHLLALGDVGSTLLTGLRLLGGDCLSAIGIYDVREAFRKRWEFEMNQVSLPWEYQRFPEVEILAEEQLFDCDLFVFCASLGIPPLNEKKMDVRMAQYEANAGLVKSYAAKALEAGFSGLFAVVSDPVDPLCRAAASTGFPAARIKGYGLGVMNARAAYYAKKEERFASFLTEGAAFGPHGEELVIANSIEHYDDALSRELTEKAVKANLEMRELGFKPYLAPALSSGALSLLATVRGDWHYSSTVWGEVFWGARNRVTAAGIEVANPQLPDPLYARVCTAYEHLKEIH